MTILDYAKSLGVRFESEHGREAHGFCPFHHDSKISFSLNTESGLWKCFAACGGGNLWQLASKLKSESLDKINQEISDLNVEIKENKNEEEREAKPIPENEVESYHANLLKRDDILTWLSDKRGIGREVINKYRIGFSSGDSRITIPIKVGDQYVNIRKYDYLHATNCKFLSYAAGYGSIQLFPMEILEASNSIILFEGEMDCLLGCELGFTGITCTGGAGSWSEDFNQYFKGKDVAICYDIDSAGRIGAAKVAEILVSVSRSVKIVSLPITEPENGDFTDYVLRHNHSAEDFRTLISLAPLYSGERSKSTGFESNVGSDGLDTVRRITLNEIGNSENFHKKVSVDVIVSGRDLSPFFCPKRVSIECNIGRAKCYKCPKKNGGNVGVEFCSDDMALLKMIDCSEYEQKQVIADKAEIKNCNAFKAEIESAFTVEHIRVIPELNTQDPNAEYVSREVYCLGSNVRANEAYTLSGIILPNPQTQYATLLADKVEPRKNSLDDFKLTDEQKEALKVFQVTTTIDDKLNEIYDDLSHNVTHIYNRNDLLLAMDLVFHSVLEFEFMKKHVKKGWAECLIIGDTRCGKSETATALLTHYKLGELCTGENTSYAGLVGGMSQLGNRWSISWGKIPLNDRRLIIIDEVSGLKVEEIANLSGIRSSGIAEIVKIQTEKTHARTRLIWLSNTRSGRPIDTYSHGVAAVKELIGKTEDVARFDFALTCASNEVNVNEIFRNDIPERNHKYTSDLCKTLLMWLWSKTLEQVVFSNGATRKILEVAEILGRKYSASVPLVEGSDERIKVARLAGALAGRLYSVGERGELYVDTCHVEAVYKFLEHCYSKPSMAYDLYSKDAMRQEVLVGPKLDTMQKEFTDFTEWRHLLDVLFESQFIKRNDLLDQIGYNMDEGRYLFRWMSKNHFIKATGFGYIKTPALVDMLKKTYAGWE